MFHDFFCNLRIIVFNKTDEPCSQTPITGYRSPVTQAEIPFRIASIYYYSDALGQEGAVDETYEPEWELFDLEKDPRELNNVIDHPDYHPIAQELKNELHRLQDEVGDERYVKDVD